MSDEASLGDSAPAGADSRPWLSGLTTAVAGGELSAKYRLGLVVIRLAERAERTSGSLYGQFGSKDGLIVALLDASIDVVAEAMFADIEAATSLDGRLAALWRNFASPPVAVRDWVQFEHEMWVWANRPGNAGARARLAERYQARFSALAKNCSSRAAASSERSTLLRTSPLSATPTARICPG